MDDRTIHAPCQQIGIVETRARVRAPARRDPMHVRHPDQIGLAHAATMEALAGCGWQGYPRMFTQLDYAVRALLEANAVVGRAHAAYALDDVVVFLTDPSLRARVLEHACSDVVAFHGPAGPYAYLSHREQCDYAEPLRRARACGHALLSGG